MRTVGRRLLREAVRQVRAEVPDALVTSELDHGDPATLLLDRGRAARLLVVGARGAGVFRALTVGPIGPKLAAHAACPVAVVRGTTAGHERIVVGTDGSSGAQAAVEFGFAEAAARGARLRVLQAFAPAAPETPQAFVMGAQRRRMTVSLSGSIAPWRDKYPEVAVSEAVIKGHPLSVLIDGSAFADLLVLGSRGAGGFAGLRSGAVSTGALQHARCPVVIVRHQPSP
ncbi:universal stress protein [Actinomadura barringtoniae]|uniref:Universal stress protein n=1 Tax=Actinomadura barringtoniae TaxID=1427535 RepID=A0A939PQ75_9ACTN|nr:universal stress protein [Actinomadura barringtoniae]MBO2452701.1 universal stress protein [Actinomadura barringtoniae]